MRNIILGKEYMLTGKSNYFLKKYGTYNPIARIDDRFTIPKIPINSWEDWENWLEKNSCYVGISSTLYWERCRLDRLSLFGVFYYSHIQNLGELIHESEIGGMIEK